MARQDPRLEIIERHIRLQNAQMIGHARRLVEQADTLAEAVALLLALQGGYLTGIAKQLSPQNEKEKTNGRTS